jgi:hypothetical protein
VQIVRGFSFMLMCMPLRERNNWMWGTHGGGSFCCGPLRFRFCLEHITR